jgi:glycosyltransferase involved in cell wall biosynthesis/predicted metal-dependent phosphoesterase TrpH
MKIDLHVHSKYSTRPSQWVLQKLGCQECYTEPQTLYRLAKKQGMSLVTITDHNVIDGSLEISHLPDTFISEELTTYFPEDGCKAHVLVYDINEEQHRDLQKARENIYDLVNYLQENSLTHTLAHPFWSVNDRLTPAHFEKFLLLFKNLELNGARDGRLNEWLRTLLSHLSPADIETLAEKHGIAPGFHNPWQKNLTAGSDDHSSLNIARMYTQVERAINLRHFFHSLNSGHARPKGEGSTPITLGYNLYSIAYQFYRQKYDLGKYADSSIFINFVERFLLTDLMPKHSRFQYYRDKIKYFFKGSPQSNQSDSLLSLIVNEITKAPQKSPHEPGVQWFQILNDIAANILKPFHEGFRQALAGANLLDLINSVTSSGIIYLGLTPYLAAFSSFSQDRSLGVEIIHHSLARPSGGAALLDHDLKFNLAHFTDTFYEVNGVGLTLRRQVEAAVNANKKYTVITCDEAGRPPIPGVRNFVPLGVFHLPEYPEQKLFHPPFLEILNYCYENNFTHIKTATPGPMGLAALGVARLLRLPIWGTYHTALPQYTQYLTGDAHMEEMMWKYIVWFYNQMDLVFAPSGSTAEELAQKGVDPQKLRVYPRGVDLERFHPSKRNGVLEKRYQVKDGLKLLYVGRVSKEKNLQLLAGVFKALVRRHPALKLFIVGDGPYLEEMRREMWGAPCVFTGYLAGEDLSEVYASCDLFVFPSTTDTFGNVVLEAQASGLPVIVTDSGGPQENLIDGETGIIVPGDDEGGLLAAINSLLAHPERLRQMGQAARDYAQQRSFESAFQNSWQMYEEKANFQQLAE